MKTKIIGKEKCLGSPTRQQEQVKYDPILGVNKATNVKGSKVFFQGSSNKFRHVIFW